ncbi:MAG: amidohydrolase family protein [Candidatus Limnocylindria bacterium]
MTLIIDTHVHLYRTKEEGRRAKEGYEIWEYGSGGEPQFAAWAGDPDDLAAAMVAAGASYAVVTNMLDQPAEGADPGEELVAFNEWLCDLASRRPQFIPCLAVAPAYLPVPDLVSHIREMAANRGAVGVKLHPPVHRLNLADEAFWPVLEACQELGLRVVSHSGPSRAGQQYGEPNAFRPVLDAFPQLKLVLAHLGGAAWQQTVGLADDYPQVYFDCCEIIEWLGASRAPTREGVIELLRAIGTDRVMMGSDFPWYDIAHTVALVQGLPGLTGDETEHLLGANAARFFDLPVPGAGE